MTGAALVILLAVQGPLGGLDRFVERAMGVMRVPGVAVAVIRGDSILVHRGYGVRRVGGRERVDPETMFAIGSATKTFTASAIGMLVDEGALGWDDLVRDRLPGFRLRDEHADAQLTIRDLLAHRSGLPRCDFWYGTAISRDEVLRRVRFCDPTIGFRNGFGYQNLMYLAAGQLIAARTGQSWDDFLRTRIFRPLGMSSTSTTLTDRPNRATPHAVVEGRAVAVPWRRLDNVAPAGAINSNLVDMIAWVRAQLALGRSAPTGLLSDSVTAEMRTAQIPIRNEGFPQWQESPLLSYGLGWFLWAHRGRLVAEHSGGIDGMSADVALLPSLGIGVIVLANATESNLPPAVVNWVLDAVTGTRPHDWIARLEAAAPTLVPRERSAAVAAGREQPAGDLGGRYADSLYGAVTVTVAEGKATIAFDDSDEKLALEAGTGDVFIGRWNRYRLFGPTSRLRFERDPSGIVRRLRIEGMATFGRIASP